MKAAILESRQQFEIREIDIPFIQDNEVLIRVLICGVCASEYNEWENGANIGKVFGHEAVGIVVKTGCQVSNFKQGDRVTGIINSAFSQYAKTLHSHLIKVPDCLSDEEAIGEPLACLMSGALATDLQIGQRCAVVGTGYMGLIFMQLMNIKGAYDMIAVDTRDEALQNARRFGANSCYLPQNIPSHFFKTSINYDNIENGIDVVAECTGVQNALTLCGQITKTNGILSIVGYHQNGSRTVDMQLLNWKCLTLINAHVRDLIYGTACIEKAFNLIIQKKLNTKDLVTHRYSLNDINTAFKDLKQKPEGYIKGVVFINS